MTQFDLTPEQELKIYNELIEEDQRRTAARAKMTPELANNIGTLYRNNPYTNPGAILAAGQAVTAGAMSMDQAMPLMLTAAKNDLDYRVRQQAPAPDKPEKKGWFERNIASKVRTASRWTFATLNFVPQAVTNIVSQPFTENPEGQRGFFISTDLGTMLANDNEAGDGWFMGGKAMQLQAERARRYRGEIDGHAFTLGRGAASLITQPGSREYNILSGLVDAAAAISIPAAPGFKAAQGLAEVGLGKAGMRTLAGLTDFASADIVPAKVASFLDSRGGQNIINRISKIGDIDEALRIFEGVQDMGFINKMVELTSPTEIRNYLQDTLAKAGPRSVNDINISRFDDVKANMVGRFSPVARMMEKVPGRHLIIQGGNARDIARSVRNMNQYLKTARVDAATRRALVQQLSNDLVDGGGDVFATVNTIQNTIRQTLRAQGVPDEAVSELMSSMKQFMDEKDTYGVAVSLNNPSDFAQKIPMADGTWQYANNSKPGLMSETLRTTQLILPDVRETRRMTSKIGWIYGKKQPILRGDMKKIGALRNQIDQIDQTADDDIAKLRDSLEEGADEQAVKNQIAIIENNREAQVMRIKDEIADIGEPKLKDPSKYGQLRMPFAALEAFQNQIWRPVTLMTGGYVLRNMADSAFRYTMQPGLKGGVFHPIQWINIASFRRFKGTLTGDDFARAADAWADEAASAYFEAVGQGIREGFDPISTAATGYRHKVWSRAGRNSGADYRKGIMDNIALMRDDAVSRLYAAGYSEDDIVDLFFVNKGRGLEAALEGVRDSSEQYARKLQRVHSNRDVSAIGDPNLKTVGSADYIQADGTFTDFNKLGLREHATAQGKQRLDLMGGRDQTIRDAIATGKITNPRGELKDIFEYREINGVRKPVGYSKDFEDAIDRVIREDQARIARGEKPVLADQYKYRIEIPVRAGGAKGELGNVLKGWDKTVDYFFSSLYPKRSAYLMQSPAFRQYYYQQAARLVDELDATAINDMKKALETAAQKAGQRFDRKFVANYVGDNPTERLFGKGIADTLFAKMENPTAATGKLTLDELDAYAKGYALDSTKNLFYNAAEKSNFADILRIVSPFGSAWAEVLRSWSGIAFSNPESLKRIGVSVQGLRDMDPDGDGKGFFWKDPNTGEYVFTFPFSERFGGLAAALTPIGAGLGGVLGGAPGLAIGAIAGGAAGAGLQQAAGLENVRFTANPKNLSMGLTLVPSIGPMMQVAAGKILGKVPEADAIRDILLPYGEPDITTVGPVPVPSWARKVIDGVTANPDNNRMLGDLMIDMMQVLHSSGDYNLSDPNDQERLEDDALSRARTLLVLRGLGQFVGPARPEPEFKVETYEGDKYVAELAKAFRTMQQEDYDTAVLRFIDAFGEDAFLYVQSKSRATVGGISPAKAFGEFEAANDNLFRRYPQVAGYFAPEAEGFDYQVYARQFEMGRRERIKPSDFIEEAQATVGRALYRASVRAAGPTPSQEQRDYLSFIRTEIGKLFPGFATAPVNFGIQQKRIEQLRTASIDGLLDGNPVAEGARLYFEARDRALEEARGRTGRTSTTLAGKQMNDLRTWLRSAADEIILRYPEFRRMYDRVLFDEIDVDTGEGST